ncbi:MAG: MerR family DNA-binding transcriptional regulator [Elusimicrobiota bacterium]
MSTEIITTGEACRRLGIPIHKFCYLEQRGLIPRAQRTSSGKRIFTDRDVSRLRTYLAASSRHKQEKQDVL